MVVDNLDEMKRFEDRIKYSFNKIWFHRLNASKVDEIVAFWFGAPKEKACFIGGVRGDRLLFPYSSPFSMIEIFKHCKNEEFESFVDEIDLYCTEHAIKENHIVFPPMIYDETNITKCISAFLRKNYDVCEMGLNFHIEIDSKDGYLNRLHNNARGKLNQALTQDFNLSICETYEEKREAYEIIAENRKSKNYYLSMSWDEVESTIAKMEHDFFILSLNGKSIASAVVFKVTKDVRQMVYWGDIPGYADARPMNYLPYALHEFYRDKGDTRILDIGPSMLEGKPNYSLCDYKESIGGSVSSKFILRKEY